MIEARRDEEQEFDETIVLAAGGKLYQCQLLSQVEPIDQLAEAIDNNPDGR